MTKDNSCRPPSGETYLTIGQDFFSIEEYVLSQYNASLHSNSTRPLASFAPAATMFYTDIQTLRGLDKPVDYGSGIEYADGLAQAFPDDATGIQIGLWLNGTAGCQDIVSGALDDQLHQLFHFLKHVKVPKVFLRVGYEFDNPWFGYSEDPLVYQQAYKMLVRTCEKQLTHKKCHEKIAFCWHSWAAPKIAPLKDFYPGDDVVDWVGISIFQQLYPWANLEDSDDDAIDNNFAGGSREQVLEVLEFAKQHGKPIMIAESTPFGGMYLQDLPDPSLVPDKNNEEDVDIWKLWFEPILELIEEYDIGMWSYIHCDWNSQPMWKGVGFGDTRLSISKNVMEQWRERIMSKESRFLNQLDCHDDDPHHHHRHHHHHSTSTDIDTGKHEGSHLLTTMMLVGWTSTEIIGFFLPRLCLFATVVLFLYKISYRCKNNSADEESQDLKGDYEAVEQVGYGSMEEKKIEKKKIYD